ncbi:hypothetical protein [Brevibacillus laterosporus]|uniref:hypothetical protein n=1 Tax=Brevibacillus laterosporus TaxID=1465 RepID=UPI0018F8A769|nr:hypothetical protein [Brevibacillus laterosporus]
MEWHTFNRFAYVNGNPVGFIDPLGLAGLGTGQCQKGKAEGTPKAQTREDIMNIVQDRIESCSKEN